MTAQATRVAVTDRNFQRICDMLRVPFDPDKKGWEGFGDGYKFLGYIGNSERNYITDEWLLKAARSLRWDMDMVVMFICGKWGRWTFDAAPMTYTAFRKELAGHEETVREYVEKEGVGVAAALLAEYIAKWGDED